ncbi:hypothetical protein D3C77_354080 [compost metagenome]
MQVKQFLQPDDFPGIFCRYSEFVASLDGFIFLPKGGGHLDLDFLTLNLGNMTALFQLAPGNLIQFRPDEREYIPLAPVLPNERCRQSQAPRRLDICRGTKYGRRKQMNLIVNNQPPVPFVKQTHMLEFFLFPIAVGQNLISRYRDRPYLLPVAGILPDFLPR